MKNSLSYDDLVEMIDVMDFIDEERKTLMKQRLSRMELNKNTDLGYMVGVMTCETCNANEIAIFSIPTRFPAWCMMCGNKTCYLDEWI